MFYIYSTVQFSTYRTGIITQIWLSVLLNWQPKLLTAAEASQEVSALSTVSAVRFLFHGIGWRRVKANTVRQMKRAPNTPGAGMCA